HTQANRELADIATKKGAILSKAPSAASTPVVGNGTVDSKNPTRGQADRSSTSNATSSLASLNGSEFDREFIRQMVTDHEQTIAKFESAQNTVQDADLKMFITKTLPTLREHLNQARSLNK